MLNQNRNSDGATLLPDSVINLTELRIGTGTTRFLNVTIRQLLTLLPAYSKDDICPDYMKAMMAKVSDRVFDTDLPSRKYIKLEIKTHRVKRQVKTTGREIRWFLHIL